MVEMQYIFQTSMTMISLYQTLETVGYIVGTFVGLTYRYLNRQLVVGVCFIILTVANTVLPVVPNIPVLYVCAIISGFCSSVIMCSYTVWTVELWPTRSAPVLYIEDFSYGIGSTLTSVILKPYLTGKVSADVVVDRRAKLMWPFITIGICVILVPLSSLIMYFIKPYKQHSIEGKVDKDDDRQVNHVKLFDRPDTPGTAMRVLFIAWCTAYILFQMEFLKFIFTYMQKSPVDVSPQTGSDIMIVSTSVYTAFTVVNAVLTIRVGVNPVIYGHYSLVVVAACVLVIGHYYLVALWVAAVLMCWAFSAMFAGVYAFTEQYVTLTNRLSTGIVMARGVCTLFTPVIIGQFIDDHSYVFLIVEWIYLTLSIALFLIIIWFIRRYQKLIVN
ncbi:sodium-dependent glucose transporter 1A-like [Oppia nitens]|uniref:sodium-dependent glucose transporter 1A-like n=1 Tax=Oppia nitens TaxID=1686743 RepID=UPI0023DC08E5|nr:sodium-dependent glucose transporter 1A-like [Oppia nitens]